MPRMWRGLAVALLLVTAVVAGGAQKKSKTAPAVLAATPPMGWNSWDSYGLTITEAQFRANVDVLTKRLKPVGYEYAVVDEGWYLANPAKQETEAFEFKMDGNGRYVPSVNRYPSAAGDAGFQPVADNVAAP